MLKAQFIGFLARLLEGLGMVLAYLLAAAFAGAVILLIVCIIAEMDKEGKRDVLYLPQFPVLERLPERRTRCPCMPVQQMQDSNL